MRVALLLSISLLALAGCTTPVAPVDPLVGVCPQWLDGEPIEGNLQAGDDATIDAPRSMQSVNQTRFLDRFHLVVSDIQSDGRMELRAFAVDDGRPLRFTDYRDAGRPTTPTFLSLDDGTGTVDVDIQLTDLTHGAEPGPTAVRLVLTGVQGATGDVHVVLTPGYRVCGAAV